MISNFMVKGAFLMAFTVLSLGVASGAQATGPDTSPDTSRSYTGGPTRGASSSAVEAPAVVISSADHALIKVFLAEDYHEKCANEADQKKNKCPSPGQAGEYGVGAVLPADSGATNLPDKLRAQLKPDAGHQYVRADGDVLLVNSSNRLIVDAVTLVSALGQ